MEKPYLLLLMIMLLISNSFSLKPNFKHSRERTESTYGGCDYDKVYTPIDSAFKYEGGALWMEWWTFYAYDNANNVSAMINNIFVKAIDLVGVSIVYPSIYTPTYGHNSADYYTLSDFSATSTNPSNTVGPSEMTMLDTQGNKFHVKGNSKDNNVLWDLYYQRGEGQNPLCLGNGTDIGYDQRFSWISYIPGAVMSGSITANGKTYQVSGYGENDHVWGKFVAELLEWTWAECYDGDSLIYFFEGGGGVDELNKYGTLYLRLKETGLLLFHKGEYQLDQDFGSLNYPQKTTITLSNVRDANFTLTYAIDSVSYTTPDNASENNAFFVLDLCQTGECYHKEARGWTEYSGANN